jgi:hypothetical protein
MFKSEKRQVLANADAAPARPEWVLRDDVEIALERDGRVRVETIDIFDALWDVLKDREENATGRKEAR